MAIVIFLFSSQSSKDSNNLSYSIDIKIFNFINKMKEKKSVEVAKTNEDSSKKIENTEVKKTETKYPVNDELFHSIDVVVRKTAHVTLYALFATMITIFLKTYGIKNWKIILFVIVIGFLYACLDEYNQKIRGTRTGIFTDTLIDTSGCFIGICLVIIFSKIFRRIKS